MPLPLIIGAAIAGATGVGAGVHGVVKIKEANDKMALAKLRHERNIERFEKQYKITNQCIDKLRKKELEILKSFDQFSDLFEQIQNRPVFKPYEKDDVKIPEYTKEEIVEVSHGSTILGVATLGVGFLVGGAVCSIIGSKLSDKADEAWTQMEKAEREIKKIYKYLRKLSQLTNDYRKCISKVNRVYQVHLNKLYEMIVINQKKDWNNFSEEEKMIAQNTVLLVNLLYNMGKVKLVLVSENKKVNKINNDEVNKTMENAQTVLKNISI